MIIIPLNTDAPIYHWPWMSLVLIAANVGVFILTAGGSEAEGWLLQYGHGLHPTEWLLSNFVHFGVLHLIGNMIFLWAFGIVVEGKLGWWRYLLVYLLIGLLGCLTEQTAMLGHVNKFGIAADGSGGASGCIYGLLAICIVWAPKNEMDCFVLLVYRALIVEVSIKTFGGWFVALEVFWAWWGRFAMSSAMLHLIGAFWGFAIGISLLKLKWVDCENWDLFAVWNGTYGEPSKISNWNENIVVTHQPRLNVDDMTDSAKPVTAKSVKKKRVFRPSIYLPMRPKRDKEPTASNSPERPQKPEADESTTPLTTQRASVGMPAGTRKTLERMRELLRQGKAQAALLEYHKRLRIIEHWPLEAEDLQALADGLAKLRAWTDAIPLLEEFVTRFPGQDDHITIKLAAIYCEVQKRPRAALKLLDQVENRELSPDLQEQVEPIRRRAQRLIEDGVLELDGQSW